MQSSNLSDDSYACLADHHLVFSDLRNDLYRCLSRENTEVVIRAFPGFQTADSVSCPARIGADHTHLVRIMGTLSTAGLVSDTAGRPFGPIRLPVPTGSLLGGNAHLPSRLRLHHVGTFMQACLQASGKLRLLSMRNTARGVEARRRKSDIGGRYQRDAMHELSMTFHRMRPYYPRSYLCRFDSLALIEFLAHHRYFPLWVFGVRCEPFGAHCWVQDEEYVLNDSVEVVRQYTPIMAF